MGAPAEKAVVAASVVEVREGCGGKRPGAISLSMRLIMIYPGISSNDKISRNNGTVFASYNYGFRPRTWEAAAGRDSAAAGD